MDKLMNKRELAAYLGVTFNAVTKMVTKRNCPRITWVGRNARFDPADVLTWVEAHKEQPVT